MTSKTKSEESLLWAYHEDRVAAIEEVHARPALEIISPAIVLHIAFTCPEIVLNQLFEQIIKTTGLDKLGNLRHAIGNVDGIEIKIERHTEFTTCTFIANNTDEEIELTKTYRELLSTRNVKILSKCKIILVASAKELLAHNKFGKRLFGGMMRGDMQVQSNLLADDHNNITYAVHPCKSSPNELGRRIQRLYEMETYRIIALIGLPLARRMSSSLSELEGELNIITAKLDAGEDNDDLSDQELFQKLSHLSGKADKLRSETRYRFSASNAYFNIVEARTTSLEEKKAGDLQTISGFLRSRLEPAQATIKSVERRQETLTKDIGQALTLLRTRIEIDMAKGNQALLKSLDGRHKQQLLLSQAVESLSSIAITYYAAGLLSYFLKGLEKSGQLPISSTLAMAIAVPVILLMTWYFIRRLRIRLHNSSER